MQYNYMRSEAHTLPYKRASFCAEELCVGVGLRTSCRFSHTTAARGRRHSALPRPSAL